MEEKQPINWGKYKKKTNCFHCNTKLVYGNTSVISMAKGYCHTCYNNLVNSGIIKQ